MGVYELIRVPTGLGFVQEAATGVAVCGVLHVT